jgi:hypothetical protein
MIGIALGNGPSRKDFDLNSLKGSSLLTIGCNWLFRDFIPDILVAIDNEPCEVIRAMENRSFKWLSDSPDRSMITLDGKPICPIMDVNGFLGKNSGIISCSYLAKIAKCERVYMIGFDFFRLIPGAISNDIYVDVGQQEYKNFDVAWNKLIKDCSDTDFIRVGPIDDCDKDFYFNKLVGFQFISYEEFGRKHAENTL